MAQQHAQPQAGIKVLKKYKKYEADLKLDGFETYAANEMVVAKLREHGFTNVVVSGSGRNRKAVGVWSKEDQPITEMPKQILEIREL